MPFDVRATSPLEFWKELDPELRDEFVRGLEKLRAEAEQAASAKEEREERFVKRLLAFAGQRGRPDDQGYRYILIWYAKTHGERAIASRRGRKTNDPPSPESQRVAALLKEHLRTFVSADVMARLDKAITSGWRFTWKGKALQQMAGKWRREFIFDFLTEEERYEYDDLIESVLPPIDLPPSSWRHRHEAATSCLAQGLLVGMAVLTVQLEAADNARESPPSAKEEQVADGGHATHNLPSLTSSATQGGHPAKMEGKQDDVLPSDAGADAGACGDGNDLMFTGEYVAWNSHDMHFCGSFGTVFRVRGGSASATTVPNGRFEMRLPNAPVVLLDVIPSSKESQCNSATGFYAVPTIAVASRNVICAGGRWAGREFLAGAQPYDPAKAYVLVHIDGPARAVSISAAHGQTQVMNGRAWVPGAIGTNIYFPEIDPSQGQTKVIADDAIAPDSIPLIAGTMTEVTIVTGLGVR